MPGSRSWTPFGESGDPMPTVKVTAAFVGDEVFVDIEHEGAVDRVGPLQDDGVEFVAVLEPPELNKGRTPPGKAIKRLSQKQELRNAEMLGGRTQPMSGASNRAKGDVRKFGEYRGESKFTFARSYTLEKAVLEKIASECGEGEKPLLFLDYKTKTTGKTTGSFVVMFESDFEELLKKNATPDDKGSSRRRPR